MLKITGISKQFTHHNGDILLFDDFSLSAADGEFLAVCGPSGSGKTTLMLMAGALLPPTSGKVYVDDTDLYALSSEKRSVFRAEKIGFVFQQFHLIPYLTVRENITLPHLAHYAGETSSQEHNASTLIEELGLTSRSEHLPSELSAGEKQRVALSRALFNAPTLLIADEPTGNLDDENADIVVSILRKYAEKGNTVIMVSHSRTASEKADRILNIGGSNA